MEVTGSISIWVKNLANVANVAGWVQRKGATWAGPGPACLSVCLSVGQYTFLSLSCLPICLLAFLLSADMSV